MSVFRNVVVMLESVGGWFCNDGHLVVYWINYNVGNHSSLMLLRGVYDDCIMNYRLRVVSSVDDIGRSHNWGVLRRGVHGNFGVQLDIWWVNY